MSENSIDNDNYECYTVNEMDALSSDPGDEGYIGPVSTYKDNFDVYFVVDRANYTDEVLRSYCQKILETSEKIWAVSPNVNILLYAVNGNGYSHFDNYGRFKNAGALKTELDKISQNKNVLTTTLSDGTTMREVYLSKAVDSIINSYDGKRKIYGFVFFDSANNIFQTKGDSKALLYGVKYGDRKINISVCSNIPEKYKTVGNYDEMSYAVALYKMTNGIDISAGDFTNQALEHIYGEVPKENQYQYQTIIATGYKPVVLKKKLTPYDMELAEKRYNDPDYIFSDAELANCEDTDEDGLKDFEKVMFKHPIGYDDYNNKVIYSDLIEVENGELKLPQIKNIVAQMSDFGYSQIGMEKAFERYKNELEKFYDMHVLPIQSNPTSVDSDADGITDRYDYMPFIFAQHYFDIVEIDDFNFIPDKTKCLIQKNEADSSFKTNDQDCNEILKKIMHILSNSVPAVVMTPTAATMLHHYLDATGTDYNLNVKNMITFSTTSRNVYDEWKNSAKQYINSKNISNGESIIIMSSPNPKHINENMTDEEYAHLHPEKYFAHYYESVFDVNYNASVGTCSMIYICKGEKIDDRMYFSSRYIVYDYYDFQKGSTKTFLPYITDGEMYLLHECGLARSFRVYGELLEYE